MFFFKLFSYQMGNDILFFILNNVIVGFEKRELVIKFYTEDPYLILRCLRDIIKFEGSAADKSIKGFKSNFKNNL